jgi:hypothetical protein
MGQAQKLELSIRGLYTSPNLLSGVPEGALEIADNIVIPTKNLAQSRRGQKQYGNTITSAFGPFQKIFNYASSLIIHYGIEMGYDSGDGVWVAYSGTYRSPSGEYKMRSLEALKNFYFTTDAGIYKLDALTSTPKPAGAPKALGGSGSTTGASGFLVEDSAVAYRLVWGYRDLNGNLILGAPSQRLIVVNPSGSGSSKDVNLIFDVPDQVTTDYFYQIYRSFGTATANDEPNDELQLVLQNNVTAFDIGSKFISVTDSTPYSLMRTTLYTSPSQEGIANSNYQPPFAYDMDVFKNCAFYANTKQKQSLTLALISVDSPSFGYLVDASVNTHTNFILDSITSTADLRVGMRAVGTGIPADAVIVSIDSGTQVTLNKATTATATVSVEFQDRFSVGGVDYWAGSAEDLATNTFYLDNTSTPGTNVQESALNLIRVINRSSFNTTTYAYYTSGVDDLPGQMVFEERSIGGDSFFATSTAGTSFSPPLPNQRLISSISVANPTVITSVGHGLTTGDSITIYSSNSTPTVNGAKTVTVLNANTFTVPVHVTVSGNTGYWVKTADLVESDNDAKQNRVFVSKNSQIEAVPLYSYFDIGSANFPIQRVVALRDGIFFFKQDGVYRISGETFSSFTVTLIDNTVALKASETAQPFNNQVFCMTTQGVVAVTDSGVKIMSVPIEDTLLRLSSDQYVNFSTATFGVAYESARLYILFTVTDEEDEVATQAFVYNSLTDSWTRWEMTRTCGVVNTAVNKLFMAKQDGVSPAQVLIERKSYTNSDFVDEEYVRSISAIGGNNFIIDTTGISDEIVPGWVIEQGPYQAVIVAFEALTGTITVDDGSGFVLGDATLYASIQNKIQWAPIDAENPGVLKQFSECTFMFKNAAFRQITANFATNISTADEAVPVLNFGGIGLFGEGNFGELVFGGEVGGGAVLRTYVPREKQRGSWLTLSVETNQAFTGFSLEGVSLMLNPMSSRVR